MTSVAEVGALAAAPPAHDMRQAAINLVQVGYPVIPLHDLSSGVCSCGKGAACGGSSGKHPRVPQWESIRSTPEAVAAWWAQWPNANIGVRMGGSSRLLALDVDGPEGRASLAALEAKHGPLPSTLAQRTGRADGGEQRIFACPSHFDLAAIHNSARKIAPGLDVRAEGGQIVVPPSLHLSGRRYEWTGLRAPEPLPEWLYQEMTKGGQPTTPRVASANAPDGRVIVGEGGRNAHLASRAGEMRNLGFSADAIESALQIENIEICDPPVEPAEVSTTARSIARYEPENDPRDPDCLEIVQGLTAAARSIAPVQWTNVLDRASRIGGGDTAKMPTGFASFDRATRGGLRTGILVVLGGAPGAGKTALATQLGHTFALRGLPVTVLAADEDPDGLLTRMGQLSGIAREDLENGKPEARAQLVAALGACRFDLVDADEDGATIETVAAAHHAKYGPGGVFIVDSLHTIRCAGSIAADGPRARIDAVLAALKAAAKRYGLLVIATSEISRGSYRNEEQAEATNPLAAGKESGGIEYAASVLLVLRTPRGEGGIVSVAMPKNRLGTKLDFELVLDPARASLREMAMPPGIGPTGHGGPLRTRVLRHLHQAMQPLSKSALQKLVGGRAQDIRVIVDQLVEDGAVMAGTKGYVLDPRQRAVAADALAPVSPPWSPE